MKLFNSLLMNCREATLFHEKKKEGKINLTERLKLSLHLSVCKICRLFFKQMDDIETSAAHLSKRTEKKIRMDAARKQLMAQALKQQMGR